MGSEKKGSWLDTFVLESQWPGRDAQQAVEEVGLKLGRKARFRAKKGSIIPIVKTASLLAPLQASKVSCSNHSTKSTISTSK